MVINTNIAALNAANDLDNSTNALNASLARLSTGSQLNNASDNPAGLAESISLNAQIGETSAANNNVANALSFAQTQDGYLQQVGSALNQMAALAVQAQDGTLSPAQAEDYNTEFQALSSFVSTTASKSFNGVGLFAQSASATGLAVGGTAYSMAAINLGTGSNIAALTASTTTAPSNPLLSAIPNSGTPVTAGNFTIAVGAGTAVAVAVTANESMNDVMAAISTATGGVVTGAYSTTTGKITLTSTGGDITLATPGSGASNFLTATGLSAGGTATSAQSSDLAIPAVTAPTYDVSNAADASTALTAVTNAITELGTDRATVGASEQYLNATSQQLGVLKTNLSAANSQISDVDVATESTSYAKYQILVQSGTAMLSQANQNPQSVLKLLQGL